MSSRFLIKLAPLSETLRDFPYTMDGLQCIDCALRTHLSQIAIQISVEIAKYDAVFVEYKHIHSIMDRRSIPIKDHTILE